jgi:hypothetical protein
MDRNILNKRKGDIMNEYKVEFFTENLFTRREKIISGLEKELNSYAAQGWRLVSVAGQSKGQRGNTGYFLFLERDKGYDRAIAD